MIDIDLKIMALSVFFATLIMLVGAGSATDDTASSSIKEVMTTSSFIIEKIVYAEQGMPLNLTQEQKQARLQAYIQTQIQMI